LSYHIDELCPQSEQLPSLKILNQLSLAALFENSIDGVSNRPNNVHHMDSTIDYSDMPLLEGHTAEDYANMDMDMGQNNQNTDENMDTMEDAQVILVKPI
jgi:hypothetical protein